MKRSFYQIYFSIESGGGFFEWDYITTSKKNLEKAIKYGIISLFPYSLDSAATIDLSVVNDNEVCNEMNVLNILSASIKDIGELAYDYDKNICVLSNVIAENDELEAISELIDRFNNGEDGIKNLFKALKGKLKISIDFDALDVEDLEGRLLKQCEGISKDEEIFISTTFPIILGSQFLEMRTEDIYFKHFDEEFGFDVEDFFD